MTWCSILASWLMCASAAEKVPYGVAPKIWDAALGHHRACVRVEAKGDAVWVHIPWRRRDHDADRKNIVVIDAATSQRIKNVVRANVNREFGDLVFMPATVPGDYYFYYLPYKPDPAYGGYRYDYISPENTADPAWVTQMGLAPEHLAQGKWKSLPQAKVIEFQARSEFDRFDPMEVVATGEEVKALQTRHADRPYLLFPEDRKYPIRMPDDLPLRWIEVGPSAEFKGQAQRNEFYAFQVGLWATGQAVELGTVKFGDLRSAAGEMIPASALRCFNLNGIDWDGRRFHKDVTVPKGKVQALWLGVDVANDAAPGDYAGTVTIRPKNAAASTVRLTLTVLPTAIEARGDNEPWRYSRLRWLDSTIGSDDDVVAPYTPLEVNDRTIGCLGRQVRFSTGGLPESIRCDGREVLAEPIRFVVQTADGLITLSAGDCRITKQTPGTVAWAAQGAGGKLTLRCAARMEFDGHLGFDVTLKANEATKVEDIRLEIPYRRDVAEYMIGVGHKGGFRPREWSWKWGGQKYYDSLWLGGVHAGLQCELRGASYCGPMVNLYWRLKQLQPPTTWNNGGKGGCTISEVGDAQVLAKAYSGPREFAKDQEMTFEFALLVTPVKKLDPAAHFRTRYYHSCEPIETVAATGANVINIHHANELNPFINYPFIANDKLSAHVRAAHERNMKLKIYYTVRELTNHVTELWALRSLGNEVLAPGGGGGFPWLREHLVTGYTPSWYSPFPDGSVCASVVTSGASRWYNYYIEGLGWLVKNIRIDGLYLDDVTYDRTIIKRMRKVMERNRTGCMIDLHSNTWFSCNPAIQYMEYFPFIDRLWFGESFDYNESPDFWLIEVSGIPFGLMGEMLQNGGNRWRGMLYGMTARLPWNGEADPRPIWKVWDDFGISDARMIGYWEKDCPVRTDRKDVLATAYVRNGKTLISVASWAPTPVQAKLKIDWRTLGLSEQKAHLYAPFVKDFQTAALFKPTEALPIQPGKGWVLTADEQAHDAPASSPAR